MQNAACKVVCNITASVGTIIQCDKLASNNPSRSQRCYSIQIYRHLFSNRFIRLLKEDTQKEPLRIDQETSSQEDKLCVL